MEVLLDELQGARLRELLVRLDRIATTSRAHRAGLHLYDYSLLDQYVQLLVSWESEVRGLSKLSAASAAASIDPVFGQIGIASIDLREPDLCDEVVLESSIPAGGQIPWRAGPQLDRT